MHKIIIIFVIGLSTCSNIQALRFSQPNLLKQTVQQIRIVKHAVKKLPNNSLTTHLNTIENVTETLQNSIEGIQNCFFSNNFHKVHNCLFRSAQMTSKNLEQCIVQYRIKTIINLRGPNPNQEWYTREHEIASTHGVTIVDIPLNSTQKISKNHIQQILDSYKQAIIKGQILVHCRNGADRTSAVSAILEYNRTHDENRALEHLSLKYGHIQEVKENMYLSVKQWIDCMEQAKFNENEAIKLYH